MGLFVVGSQVAPLSTLTFAEVKRQVAAVLSRESDDPDDLGAGDAIQQVMREMNAQRWDYLTVQGNDIALVDHTPTTPGQEGYRGRYTIPTPIRDFVSAKVDFAGQAYGGTPLEWVHRANWDRQVQTASGAGTRFITDFQQGLTNKVELLDFPQQAGRMEIRYYRPITIPTNDNETLDVPREGPLESAVIHLAKAQVAMDRGVRSKATFYEAKGQQAYAKALGVDRKKFLSDQAWQPRHLLEQNWPSEQKRHAWYGTWKLGRPTW